MASRGAKLSLADLSEDSLQRVKQDIQAQHKTEVFAKKVDVRNYDEVHDWISETVEQLSGLDGAANLAGVIPKSIGLTTVAEQDEDDWNFVFSVCGLLHNSSSPRADSRR